MNLSCYAGDIHGLSIMFLKTTYRNVTLTVTEFTEECLTVFGLMSMYCYAFIFGYLAPGPR